MSFKYQAVVTGISMLRRRLDRRTLKNVTSNIYRPAISVLNRLIEVDFVAVVGPTAVGKTTLIRHATKREQAIRAVISSTSRNPRRDEQDGVDFRFETRERMEERFRRREYVQVALTDSGVICATAPEDYPLDGVAVLPVLADTLTSFRSLPFKRMRTLYVLPPSLTTWQLRLREREFDRDELQARMAEARRSLEFAAADDHTRFVISDDLIQATRDFIDLVLDKPMNDRLQLDQTRAGEIITELREI